MDLGFVGWKIERCASFFLQPLRHVVIDVVHEEDDHDGYDETGFIHHHKYKNIR